MAGVIEDRQLNGIVEAESRSWLPPGLLCLGQLGVSRGPHRVGLSEELAEPADLLSGKLAARRWLPERGLPADIRVILGARWKTARDNALCCNDEADFKYFA